MYVAICDDEKEFTAQMEECMKKIAVNMSGLKWESFGNAEEFIRTYKKDKTRFDVLITDIEMEGMNGVELAMEVRRDNRNIIIFFVTSHTDYAIQCFAPEPMNFFVKPIDYNMVEQNMYRAAERIKSRSRFVTITEDRFPVRLNLFDIIYIEKQDRKTIIHTVEGNHITNKSIQYIQSKLPDDIFVRIYTSYMVNLAYVKKISENRLFIKDMDNTFPVSRTYMGELRRKYISFKERRAFANGDL
jgi:DNA-binding LytR/AlgR family response regulator